LGGTIIPNFFNQPKGLLGLLELLVVGPIPNFITRGFGTFPEVSVGEGIKGPLPGLVF